MDNVLQNFKKIVYNLWSYYKFTDNILSIILLDVSIIVIVTGTEV